jgi:hypothetical protein
MKKERYDCQLCGRFLSKNGQCVGHDCSRNPTVQIENAIAEQNGNVRDALNVALARNQVLSDKLNSIMKMEFAVFGGACDNHSGDDMPPFEEFEQVLGGRCHWCDALELSELKGEKE